MRMRFWRSRLKAAGGVIANIDGQLHLAMCIGN